MNNCRRPTRDSVLKWNSLSTTHKYFTTIQMGVEQPRDQKFELEIIISGKFVGL